MGIQEYIEKEKALVLEFEINLNKLQSSFLRKEKNDIRYPYLGRHVIKYPNVEVMVKAFPEDPRGIQVAKNYNCPRCGSNNKQRIGQTPQVFFEAPDPGISWHELMGCNDCHQKYYFSNGC